ncbi:hypothetical protein Hanom_Chr17g01563491 [Helianthus anomalus]
MLDEAIEYLKQLQLKVQTLTMRNRFDLPPVYAQEQGMQRGMRIGMGKGYEGIGIGYNEGYKFPNTSEGLSDPGFFSELENVKQYEFADHSTSTMVGWRVLGTLKRDPYAWFMLKVLHEQFYICIG